MHRDFNTNRYTCAHITTSGLPLPGRRSTRTLFGHHSIARFNWELQCTLLIGSMLLYRVHGYILELRIEDELQKGGGDESHRQLHEQRTAELLPA